MALGIQILKQPFEINFSGNPIFYSFAFSPYGFVERKLDLKIRLTVEKETGNLSGIFNEIFSDIFYPNNDGTVQLNISSIADAHLAFFTPRLNQIAPLRVQGQTGRFRLTALIQKDGVQFGGVIISNIITIIKGGLSYEQYHFSGYFTENIVSDKKPLQLFADVQSVHTHERKFITWLYPNDEDKDQFLHVRMILDNDTDFIHDTPLAVTSQKWGLYLVGLIFKQLMTDFNSVPVTTAFNSFSIKAYEVSIINEDNVVIVNPIRFNVDWRRSVIQGQQRERALAYHNSCGGFETATLYGEIELQGEYMTSQAQAVPPPSGIRNAIMVGQTLTTEVSETEKFLGGTDFITLQQLEYFRDLFLSRNVFEIKQGKLIPVIVNKKTVKFYSNRDNLFSMLIEWQNAFSNQFFTPRDLLSSNNSACPALDTFVIVQVAKNKVQILWSMPFPYDLLEVIIDNGTTIQTSNLSGNSGSQVLNFINPAVAPDTAPITIKGRVICDPDSDPISIGPQSTFVLNAFANLLPIANDDEFSIPAGYSDPQTLAGSVMANDYDLDDDPLEVEPVTAGATAAGGTYDIDAAGVIAYTPPTAIYNGIDSFDYTVWEAADHTSSAVATVRIKVGNVGVGDGFFVKILRRNNNEIHNGLSFFAYADFYLAFFSDPTCTIPKDATGLGISITISNTFQRKLNGNVTHTETINQVYAATGIEVSIYSGQYYFRYQPPATIIEEIRTFAILPGAGYIPV